MTYQTRRIFIVEDEVLLAFEMTDTLEDMGFEVVGPSVHLEEAQRRASADDFDLAILDVNLGRNKTSEPIARILTDRGIPFVFITAYDREQISFLDAADRVVRKPISRIELARTLQRLLPPTE